MVVLDQMGIRLLHPNLSECRGVENISQREFGRCPLTRLPALVLFATCFLFQLISSAQVKEVRRVLILNDLSIISSPGFTEVDQAILSGLQKSPYRIEVYQESLQLTFFPDKASQRPFRESLMHKYSERKPDLIIAAGSASFKFIAESDESFIRQTPIVVCAILGDISDQLEPWLHVTGVVGRIQPEETLKTALHLLPATKHVVVVGGTGKFDEGWERGAKQAFQNYESKLDFIYLTDLTMPVLLERLRHLPSNTIVYYTSISQDAAGERFISSAQSVPLVASAANAPVFVTDDVDLRAGMVGGDLVNWADDAGVAAGMAVRVLNGEKPQDIPVVKSKNEFMFDWRALKRWGVSEKNLPAGSIVLNRQPGLWESHKGYIIGSISLMVVETLLILGLLLQMRKRRKAEAELRKSESELRESEEKFSKAFRRSPLAFTIASLVDYRFVEVNDTFERYTGWRRDEVIGRTPLELKIWVDTNQRSTFIEQVLARGAVRGMELLFRKKEGQVWTGLVSSELIHLNDEPCALSLIADITELKRAELARSESEARFRLVANTAPVMIWMAGPDKLCTYFNEPWLEFTGRSLTHELGNGWAAGVHPEDLENCLRIYTNAFDGRKQFQMQYRLRRYDGEYRWIFDHGVPRFNPDDSFAGYIGSGIDITVRREAEQALADVSRKLVQVQEEERTRIARDLHDDINQRLALLAVDIEQLNQNLPESSPELIDRLTQIRERVTEVSTGVQSISHELHSPQLEYLGIVAAMKSFCRELAARQSVEIDFRSDDIPRSISNEVSLCLFRVLQEALHNAVKHSQVRHFEVRLTCSSDLLDLTIADRGTGFNPETASNKGGLGLVSMRERVRLVNGTIVIDSKPMNGTTIHVRVPFRLEQESQRAAV